jgi:hypothetical protein
MAIKGRGISKIEHIYVTGQSGFNGNGPDSYTVFAGWRRIPDSGIRVCYLFGFCFLSFGTCLPAIHPIPR